jgi:hypothetical protein
MLNLNTIVKAIDDEEEFEGEITEKVFSFASSSPTAMAEALRMACKLTKKGIRERIESLFEEQEKWTNKSN